MTVAMRMPKLAIALLFLALVALASSMTYAGFLVIGVISTYLDIGRFVAGLLLGILFARLPWVRQGKLRTVGLLPKNARRPIMVALLAGSLLHFLYLGDMVPVLFLGFAVTFLLAYRRMRQMFTNRLLSSLFKSARGPSAPGGADKEVIDVEFRERKD